MRILDLSDSTYQQLAATWALFTDIRARFDGPGEERGGHERVGVTPVYVKKFGPAVAQVFPEAQRFTVESSFSAAQLAAVNATLVALKQHLCGQQGPAALSAQIVVSYRSVTQPYYLKALLLSTEAALRAFMQQQPEHAAVLDAIFRVAGGEGLRDIVRVYGAHYLEQEIDGAELSIPDLLAFVDVHDDTRMIDGTLQQVKYEVWCPGTDLAREVLRQCQAAVRTLVQAEAVHMALPLAAEVAALPGEVSSYLNRAVAQECAALLHQYGVV